MGQYYRHVGSEDRVEIEKLVDRGASQAQIARRLGMHRSTISREVRARSWRPSNTAQAYTPYRDTGLQGSTGRDRQYRAVRAHQHATVRIRRSHAPYRMVYDRLVGWVVNRLRAGWTPEEISGRAPLEFPHDRGMRVSHETLYAWIYHPDQAHRCLWEYLPRGRKKRRKAGGRSVHTGRADLRVSIRHRPAAAEDRDQVGHWESDTVLGTGATGGIHTMVDRAARCLIAVKIPDLTAQITRQTQQAIIHHLGADNVASITVDNGSEFAGHDQLTRDTGVPVFFCDPYSAYQRGTNEHFNGRLRKYLPKGTRFDHLTQIELDEIVAEINNRPRKILGWHTPAETYQHHAQPA